MIDPRTVCVGIPAYGGVEPELLGAIYGMGGLFLPLSIKPGVSHVGLARNLVAADFLRSNCEWLVFIDSDIIGSRHDMQLLLEPCDMSAVYSEPDSTTSHDPPRPTRTTVSQIQEPETGHSVDWNNRFVAAADVLVTAEYAYKDDTCSPCRFGLGFTRIHRSVFDTLAALKHDGGNNIEVSRAAFNEARETLERVRMSPTSKDDSLFDTLERLVTSADDKAGAPRLWQVSHQGRMFYDFFPSGPILSQFVPTAEWKGEDHGFFTLCMLAGIIPRIETRTRLTHIGRKGYPYLGPEAGGGQ